jgi:hypothetical protein
LTPQGSLNADALRKLKQVNHLVGLIRPAVEDVLERFGQPVLVDAGSGNAYLGFVLYELFLKGTQKGELWCVESKDELTQRAQERAARLGYQRMRFITAPLASAPYPERIHLLTALHACDTATDDALEVAVRHNADHVAVVPCCQAEVSAQLKERGKHAAPALAPLFEHAWHRREFASHLTNVVRALALEASGYRVTVTELTGWEHSLKNELILGEKIRRDSREAKLKLAQLLKDAAVAPKIARTLGLLP